MTMNLSQAIYKNEIVLLVRKEEINDALAKEILRTVEQENKKIALDLMYVKKIQSPIFIEALIENKFKLFNLNSHILAYLAIILKDGVLKSYMNFGDFQCEKRELITRRFLIAG